MSEQRQSLLDVTSLGLAFAIKEIRTIRYNFSVVQRSRKKKKLLIILAEFISE